jgi:hypothetical protein
LTHALNQETRLVGELRDELVKQRSAVASNDSEVVYSGIQAIGRVLMMLGRAQSLRREILESLADGASPPDFHEGLGDHVPAPVEHARTKLVSAAEEVTRQLTINHRVLERAVAAGESFIKAVLSPSSDQPPSYSPSEASTANKKRTPVFVNRVV